MSFCPWHVTHFLQSENVFELGGMTTIIYLITFSESSHWKETCRFDAQYFVNHPQHGIYLAEGIEQQSTGK